MQQVRASRRHGPDGLARANIDRIANEGAIFTDAYGQQSCTAGRASFILGEEALRTGLLTIGIPGDPHEGPGSQVFANSGSIGWVDPLVGFRVRHHLAPGQHLSLEADIGGFGIGSRFSAEAQLAYGIEFGNALGINWAGVLGYRALYVDYTQGSGSSFFEMNLLQHGPLLGVRGRF